jgi:hypothetical protein
MPASAAAPTRESGLAAKLLSERVHACRLETLSWIASHGAQDLSRKWQFAISGVALGGDCLPRGGAMKTIRNDDGSVDGARVALLLGLSVGLGIAVHEFFFLVGGTIAVAAFGVATAHAIQKHAEQAQPAPQHR